MTGATQRCCECGSPLRPCKCSRGKKKPKRMKVRSYKTVHADDPLVYGVIFERVKQMAAHGECILKGRTDVETGRMHVCSAMWRATAHHSPTVGSGGDDRRCAPVCGLADDLVHSRKWGWTEGQIAARFGVNVRDSCKGWGDRAIAEEFGDHRPQWLMEATEMTTDRCESR